MMYDVFHGTASPYLTELCHVGNDDRLRSSQRGNFAVVRTRTKMADGAFTVAGPAAWNAPPPQLRNATSTTTFLSHLKTYLYNIHETTCKEVLMAVLHVITSVFYLYFCHLLHQYDPPFIKLVLRPKLSRHGTQMRTDRQTVRRTDGPTCEEIQSVVRPLIARTA